MADIVEWDVENEEFWEKTGKKIAKRNLWISIPSLLVGFAVWLYWSIITVQMLNLGFPFTNAELFTLSAIAGLSGATFRIPSSFLIRIAGGRNTIFFTTALLMIPAVGNRVRAAVARHAPVDRSSFSPSCPAWAAATSPHPCPTSASSTRRRCRACRSVSMPVSATPA